jgi:hypothetical protein
MSLLTELPRRLPLGAFGVLARVPAHPTTRSVLECGAPAPLSSARAKPEYVSDIILPYCPETISQGTAWLPVLHFLNNFPFASTRGLNNAGVYY